MAKREQVSMCENCDGAILEGSEVLYDDYRDIHFCEEACFNEWYEKYIEKFKSEYRALNVHRVDV